MQDVLTPTADQLRDTKLALLSDALGTRFGEFPEVGEMRARGRNTNPAVRHMIFAMLVTELRRQPEASVPELYETMSLWARGEVLLTLTDEWDVDSVRGELSAVFDTSVEYCAKEAEGASKNRKSRKSRMDQKHMSKQSALRERKEETQYESKFESEYERRARELGLCPEEMMAMERFVRELEEEEEA